MRKCVCVRLMLVVLVGASMALCYGGEEKFSVADDIALVRFARPAVLFSPDRRYFVVNTERGVLSRNRPESTLRIYQSEDVHQFVLGKRDTANAFWTITKSEYKDGPNISGVRWLPDSRGIAFLAKTRSGNDQFFLADLKSKKLLGLSPEDQHATGFDIRDSQHFVYSALSTMVRAKAFEDNHSNSSVGTGKSLTDLLFPEDLHPDRLRVHDLSDLWTVVDGKRIRLKDSSGRPFPLHSFGQKALALSPNGHSLVTVLPVAIIPAEWEKLYPPQTASSAYRIRAGYQDPEAIDGLRYVSEYVLIDLMGGHTKELFHSPIAHATGWWGLPGADWSPDGNTVVVSNTFLPPLKNKSTADLTRPCGVAVVEVVNDTVTCLEHLKGDSRGESGYHYVAGVRFASGSNKRVIVDYLEEDNLSERRTTYVRSHAGVWQVGSTTTPPISQRATLEVSVEQGPNKPPILVATDLIGRTSRDVWDPNPQLENIRLGEVSLFRWHDSTGRTWVGGLYKPPNYVPGQRYPMVIQTHGFDERLFSPDGIYATANAAQELAAHGILVLQIRDCPIRNTPDEGPCQISGYESAIRQLATDGLVDSDNIGIVGFSRTCYYVLQALTFSSLHFKAASITDGVNEGYLQYLTLVDESRNEDANEANSLIGAPPFRHGLNQWIEHSPVFNMDRVTAPLQVVAIGASSVLLMWEPYAALRYLNKPVDLIVLKDGTHVLTNPEQLMVSKTNTVDWFRFWLKGEEDPDAEKSEQYRRWHDLRKLQEHNEKIPVDPLATTPK